MFDKIKDIIFKIKDYDRLEHDYACILSYITNGLLSKTDYVIDGLYTVIDSILTERDERTRKEVEKEIIEKLQQEQPKKKEVKFVFPKFLYARTTNNKTIDVSYAPQSMDAIEYIRSDSPDVGLEKEIQRYLCEECSSDDEPTIKEIAHHFYKLGLKARKEE